MTFEPQSLRYKLTACFSMTLVTKCLCSAFMSLWNGEKVLWDLNNPGDQDKTLQIWEVWLYNITAQLEHPQYTSIVCLCFLCCIVSNKDAGAFMCLSYLTTWTCRQRELLWLCSSHKHRLFTQALLEAYHQTKCTQRKIILQSPC